MTRTEIDGYSGAETERDIPFMKGYTVFNVEQVEGLPAQSYARAEPRLETRTTGSTRLNELGFASDWIERQLAHAEPNAVRRTYKHAEYWVDRAKMMHQWADMLDSWKAGAIVTPIKSKAAA